MVAILRRVALTSYVLVAAQGTPAAASGISGTVSDPCGVVTPGATVSAVNRGGMTTGTITDVSGHYVLQVQPGTWTLSFDLTGFRQHRQDVVIMTPDSSVELNVRLPVAGPTEMINTHSPEARYERYATQGVVRGDDGARIPQAIIRAFVRSGPLSSLLPEPYARPTTRADISQSAGQRSPSDGDCRWKPRITARMIHLTWT